MVKTFREFVQGVNHNTRWYRHSEELAIEGKETRNERCAGRGNDDVLSGALRTALPA